MQLFSSKKAILALSIGALSALGACGDDVTVTEAVPPVVVSITPPSATMNIGESLTFAVQISGGSTTTPPTLTSCASSNASVATAAIAAGACKVTAVASGNITVTATASTGGQASASVSVTPATAAISGLTVSPSTAAMTAGQKITITPNVQKGSAAVAVAYAYVSSGTNVATVAATGEITAVAPGTATITTTATGSGAGFTTTALTASTTVTVSIAPGGVSSLTVQPSFMSLSVGSTAPIQAVAVYVTGTPQPTITFGSSNPSVATVLAVNPNTSGSGTVSAVGPGTAIITVTASQPANGNFAASSVTQLVPVTVSPSANVTIYAINQGPIATYYYEGGQASVAAAAVSGFTYSPEALAGIVEENNSQVNAPVDINSVRDQIQVVVNLQPNGQRVDSVVAFVQAADLATPRRAAARQLYSNGQANAEQITLYINTADFTANFAAGTSDVFYTNGQKIISVSVYTTDATGAKELGNASNNRQTVNFNNLDGYAAVNVNPTRVVQGHPTEDNGQKRNLNWWGGPGAAGEGSSTIVPVFYTPGRTLRVMEVSVIEGPNQNSDIAVTPFIHNNYSLGVCGSYEFAGPANPTPSPLPMKVVYGANPTATAALACTTPALDFGYEHPETNTSNFVGVVRAVDNYNNSAPRVTLASGFRRSASVPRPIANRLDYRGPSTRDISIVRERPAVTGWVNASFNFQNNIDVSTDRDGVGAKLNSRVWSFAGCGMAATPMTTMTGADIPECATDFLGGWIGGQFDTRGPYRAAYTELDRLDNMAQSDSSGRFGVDKTAPLIRFGAAGVADTARTTGAGVTTIAIAHQAEFLDERSGFVDANDYGAPVKNPAPWTYNYVDVTQNFTNLATGAIYPQDRAQWQMLSHGAGNLPAANYPTRSECLVASNSTADVWRLTNPFTSGLGNFVNPAATFLSAPGCTLAPAYVIQSGDVGDGYRFGQPVAEPREGIYRYETKVWDRAGNPSTTISRRNGIDGIAANFASISASLGVPLGGAASFQAIFEDNTEVRAASLKLQYNSLTGSTLAAQAALGANVSMAANDTLAYSQTLLDARFNDVINGPALANLSLPMGAPTVTSIEFTNPAGGVITGNLGTKLSMVGGTIWDWANRQDLNGASATPRTSAILGTGIADPVGFANLHAAFPATAFTAFQMLPSLAAGFNAGAGLKAQVTATTNSINAPFTRVDFYRRGTGNCTPSAVVATAAAFNCTQNLYYIGSSTSAVSADQGATRFWTYLAPTTLAPTYWSAETASTAVVPFEAVFAVGVRLTGEALSTPALVLTGTAINITTITNTGGPFPWSINFVNGSNSVTRTGTGSTTNGAGVFSVPVAGNYTATGNPVAVPVGAAAGQCPSGFATSTATPSPVVVTAGVSAATVTIATACVP